MFKLYRFSCRPNYSVVSKAYVIFLREVKLEKEKGLEIGEALAKECSCYNHDERQEIEYLGLFEPAPETELEARVIQKRTYSILEFENGEY